MEPIWTTEISVHSGYCEVSCDDPGTREIRLRFTTSGRTLVDIEIDRDTAMSMRGQLAHHLEQIDNYFAELDDEMELSDYVQLVRERRAWESQVGTV